MIKVFSHWIHWKTLLQIVLDILLPVVCVVVAVYWWGVTAIAYTFIILLDLVRLPDCAGEGRGGRRGKEVFWKRGLDAGEGCFWGRRYRGGAWRR